MTFFIAPEVTTTCKPGCRAHLQGCLCHHPSKDLVLPPRHCWGKLRQGSTGMAGWWYQTHPWGHPCGSGRNQPISWNVLPAVLTDLWQGHPAWRWVHRGASHLVMCSGLSPTPHVPPAVLSAESQGRGCTFLLPARPWCTCPSLQPKIWDPLSTQKMTRSRRGIKGSLNDS